MRPSSGAPHAACPAGGIPREAARGSGGQEWSDPAEGGVRMDEICTTCLAWAWALTGFVVGFLVAIFFAVLTLHTLHRCVVCEIATGDIE